MLFFCLVCSRYQIISSATRIVLALLTQIFISGRRGRRRCSLVATRCPSRAYELSDYESCNRCGRREAEKWRRKVAFLLLAKKLCPSHSNSTASLKSNARASSCMLRARRARARTHSKLFPFASDSSTAKRLASAQRGDFAAAAALATAAAC